MWMKLFQHVSVPQDSMLTRNNTRFPNPFKMSKFSAPNPKNLSKSSSESLNLGQKSVLKAAFCQKKLSSTSPQIWYQFLLQAPWKKYTWGPRYWNLPVLVNTGTFLVYQYCRKMWYLCSLECASVIQKLTILEHRNGLVLSNTYVPVSWT